MKAHDIGLLQLPRGRRQARGLGPRAPALPHCPFSYNAPLAAAPAATAGTREVDAKEAPEPKDKGDDGAPFPSRQGAHQHTNSTILFWLNPMRRHTHFWEQNFHVFGVLQNLILGYFIYR